MATSGSKSVTVTSWDTLKFSWWFNSGDQSVTNNTTLVRWKLELIATSSGRIDSSSSKSWSVTVNGTKYSGTNTVGIANNSTKTLASGTTTISHNTDGTKTFNYSFSQSFSGVKFSGVDLGTKSGSGSGTLTTIPRKSTLTASNGTLGTEQTLTINRNSSSFTHTIKYECGSASGTIVTKTTGTSVKFTPPLSLASQNTTGTTVSVKFTITTYNGSTSLGSNTKTITCTMPSSIKPSVALRVGDATGLPAYIKGKSKFSVQATTSISYNSSIISLAIVANGVSYSSTSFTTGVITKSGSQTITADVQDQRGRTNTRSITVTVYDPPTFTTIDGELGNEQIIRITSQNAAFRHTIKYECGSASGTIATQTTNTSVNFTPPLSLASQNTKGTTVPIKYTMTSYAGDDVIGYHEIGSVSKTVNCFIPEEVFPAVSVSVEDTSGAFAKYGSYVKGLSTLEVSLSPTTSYGSAIASYNTTIGNRKYTSASFDAGLITSTNDITIKATVTDERGRTGTSNEVVSNILDYSPPAVSNLTVGRCNEDGTPNDKGEFAKVSYSASVTSLNKLNTAKFTLQYKKTTETEWQTGETINSSDIFSIDKDFIFPAETGSSYDVIIIAEDAHITTTRTTSVSTGFTLMHWGDDGRSMGIGKVAEMSDVLDIGFATLFTGGIRPIELESGTDFDTITIPGWYVGATALGNDEIHNYGHSPSMVNAAFFLEVFKSGRINCFMQRITLCSKGYGKKWERHYHSGSWGEWFCVYSDRNNVLWSGAYYMNGEETITLSEPISRQPTGIVLCFSPYENSEAGNHNFNSFFLSKYEVLTHGGSSHTFTMFRNLFSMIATKTLYISDQTIKGHANNTVSGTQNGITYNGSNWVLRYVIGV